jgi:hypothetical protein
MVYFIDHARHLMGPLYFHAFVDPTQAQGLNCQFLLFGTFDDTPHLRYPNLVNFLLCHLFPWIIH